MFCCDQSLSTVVALNFEMVEGDSKSHESASEKLEAIADVVSECRKCPLAETRTNTVPGEGSPTADIMFVGEGPGRDEDLSGRPFVGRAGKFLDELIESLPMRREDVYIANVVKCRPPGNRDPERAEVEQCSGYLRQQIAAIDPLVIVPLGRHALGWFNPSLRITASNGKIFRHEDRVLMPLLHPSAGLRNPSNAEMLREGIHNLREAILEGIRVKREAIEGQEVATRPSDGDAEAPSSVLEEAEKIASDEAAETDTGEASVGLFERAQTPEEVQEEMRKQRAIEAAAEAAENEEPEVVVDDRQSSFF